MKKSVDLIITLSFCYKIYDEKCDNLFPKDWFCDRLQVLEILSKPYIFEWIVKILQRFVAPRTPLFKYQQ